MEQQQQELRHAAAQAFITSLEQLEQTFEPAGADHGHQTNPEITRPSSQPEQRYGIPMDSSGAVDMNMFDDAIADIEQFIKKMPNGQD